MTWELQLWGEVPSKKNAYTPRANGRGMFKSAALDAKINYLLLQIPPELRGLKLLHPNITFSFTVPDRRRDRDNMAQCLLDAMVQAGVLANDNIASCNGRIVIEPAQIGDQFHTRITLEQRQ